MKLLYNIKRRIARFLSRILDMQIIPTAPNLNGKMRKYRYITIEEGKVSEPQTAMAPNPQYLKQLLEATGDKIRIIEELPPDGDTQNYGKLDVNSVVEGSQNRNWFAGTGGGAAGTLLNTATPEQIQALQSMQEKRNGAVRAPQQPAQQQILQQAPAQQPVSPPQQENQVSYFKIGSTECKMENGKVYQKQWMPVNENEMMNYRLVSDKNNKILPMTGKHLEMLKWVMTQE